MSQPNSRVSARTFEHWLLIGMTAPQEPFRNFAAVIEDYPVTPGDDERLGTPMFYSSGTTGKPKAVKRQLPRCVPAGAARDRGDGQTPVPDARGDDVPVDGSAVSSGPQSSISIGLRLGATHIVMERFDTEEFLALIDEFDVTHDGGADNVLSSAQAAEEIRDKWRLLVA